MLVLVGAAFGGRGRDASDARNGSRAGASCRPRARQETAAPVGRSVSDVTKNGRCSRARTSRCEQVRAEREADRRRRPHRRQRAAALHGGAGGDRRPRRDRVPPTAPNRPSYGEDRRPRVQARPRRLPGAVRQVDRRHRRLQRRPRVSDTLKFGQARLRAAAAINLDDPATKAAYEADLAAGRTGSRAWLDGLLSGCGRDHVAAREHGRGRHPRRLPAGHRADGLRPDHPPPGRALVHRQGG